MQVARSLFTRYMHQEGIMESLGTAARWLVQGGISSCVLPDQGANRMSYQLSICTTARVPSPLQSSTVK